MGRKRVWKPPTGPVQVTIAFLGTLLLGGLIWDQLLGLDLMQVKPQPDPVPQAKGAPQSPAATPQNAAPAPSRPAPRQSPPLGTVNKVVSASGAPAEERPQTGAVSKVVEESGAGAPKGPRAENGSRRGTIIKVDVGSQTIAILAGGEDLVVKLRPETRVVDAGGERIATPFKHNRFKLGAAIEFWVDGTTLVGVRLLDDASGGRPPRDIRRGRIASIDLDGLALTLETTDTAIVALVTEQSKFYSNKGKNPKERLQQLKIGAAVRFLVREKDGRNYLVGIGPFAKATAR